MKILKIILAIITLCLLVWSYMYLQTRNVVTRNCTFHIAGLPQDFDGFTILHLSDLHSKRFGRNQSKLMGLIKEKDFDIIAITGDLVYKQDPNIWPAAELISQLKEKPIYFVPGNHEWWDGFQIKQMLEDNGVRVMVNSQVQIARGDRFIYLVGVDDPHTNRDDIDYAMQNTPVKTTTILLAHSPNIFPKAVDKGVDLVLCGHTHGGQVRFPFVGALMVPGQGLFPRWDYGVFREDKTIMLINAGLGESKLPIRFNSKPEIVFITLRPA